MIWDPQARGLFALRDSDGDGLPDALDRTNRIRLPRGKNLELDHLALARWTGVAVRIETRVEGRIHTSDAPVVYGRDRDGDGFFESFDRVRPSMLPGSPPAILGEPVAGVRVMDVLGVPGHRIEVRMRNTGEDLTLERVIAKGALSGDDGFVRLQLEEAVESGKIYRVVDLSSGESSRFHETAKHAASVSLMDPGEISTTERTTVTLSGYRLDRVKKVRVNGKLVASTHRAGAIELAVPPMGRRGEFPVQLELLDGTRIEIRLTLSPEYDY